MVIRKSIKQKALEHFDFVVEFSDHRQKDKQRALAEKDIGLRIVTLALAMAEGEVLSLDEVHMASDPHEATQLVWTVMPYLWGSLGLFTLEFVHKSLGTLPYDITRPLLRDVSSVHYEGISLTPDNVFVQYRRTAFGQ